jgi:hypothetical protein
MGVRIPLAAPRIMKIYFKHTPHNDFYDSLKSGVSACGDTPIQLNGMDVPTDAKVGVCWGIVNGNRMRESGIQDVLITERGYLINRNAWLSLGWNGLNGYATFNNQYVSGDRWRKYWKSNLANWKHSDSNSVLVCGQVLRDQSLSDCDDYLRWLNTTISTLSDKGYHVIFRPHPLETEYVLTSKCTISKTPNIYEEFRNVKCVISWSSTVGCEAIYSGIPAVAFSKHSMAYDIASHTLDVLDYMPDRELWGRQLAYTMWNSEELASGEAWDFVSTHLINKFNKDYKN